MSLLKIKNTLSNKYILKLNNKLIKIGSIKLPDDCLVLDYFDNKHIKMVSDIQLTGIEPTSYTTIPNDKTVINGSTFFDLSNSPFKELPCGTFNETTTYSYRIYSGLKKYIDNGLTIEWYSRLDNNNAWVHQWFWLSEYFHIMRTYNSNTYFTGYNGGSYYWDSSTRYSYKDIIGCNTSLSSWHHYAITFQKNGTYVLMKFYLDGVFQFQYNIRYISQFSFNGTIRDANSFGTKTGSHQVAKFIIWNTIKYTENFTPINTLEGFV